MPRAGRSARGTRIQRRRRRTCSRPASEPARRTPRAASVAVVEAGTLLREMDELHGQLEGAFGEAFERLGRLEADAYGAVQLAKTLQHADESATVVDHVRDSMASLSTITIQSLDRIEQVDEAVHSLAQRPARGARPRPHADRPADRPAHQGAGSAPAGDRARLDAGLTAMTHELTAVARTPLAVDTAALEDAANRGAAQRRRHRQPPPRHRGARRGRAPPGQGDRRDPKHPRVDQGPPAPPLRMQPERASPGERPLA